MRQPRYPADHNPGEELPTMRPLHLSRPLISPSRDVAMTHRLGWDLFSIIVLIVLIGYHLGTPLLTMMMGRGISYGFSLELIVSLLLVPFAIDGFFLLMTKRLGRLPLLALAGLVAWILLGALAAKPSSPRELVNPVGSLTIMCGAASVFYRGWPSIDSKLPTIITCVIVLFGLWLILSGLTGDFTAYSKMGRHGPTAHEVGGMRPTEFSIYLGTQFCYALLLTKLGGGYRLLGYLFAAGVAGAVVLVSGAAGAIAGVGLVLCIYVLSGGMRLRTRVAIITLVTVVVLTAAVREHIELITLKAKQMVVHDSAREERETSRRLIYRDLYETARENPLVGVGYTNYAAVQTIFRTRKVPHQNVLGLAAECGFPAAMLLVAFIGTSAWTFWRKRPRMNKPPAIVARATLFVGACLWILVYVQFRGLFMDSFRLKEGFFIVGAGLGTLLWIDHQRKRRMTRQRPTRGRPAVGQA